MRRELFDVLDQFSIQVDLLDEYRNVGCLALGYDLFNPFDLARACFLAGFRTDDNPIDITQSFFRAKTFSEVRLSMASIAASIPTNWTAGNFFVICK